MRQRKKNTIPDSLNEVYEQVVKAETLISTGDHLAALHWLLKSRNYLGQVVVNLIVECLRENLEVVKDEDHSSYERRLRNLTGIVDFALLALCPDCRHQIGVDLKEA